MLQLLLLLVLALTQHNTIEACGFLAAFITTKARRCSMREIGRNPQHQHRSIFDARPTTLLSSSFLSSSINNTPSMILTSSSATSATDPSTLIYDVERYKSRAELLTQILTKKQGEMDLVHSKLAILQNVVQKQKHKQREEQQQQEEQMLVQLEKEKNQTQVALLELETALRKEQGQQIEQYQEELALMRESLNMTQHRLHKRKSELQHQQLFYQSQIDHLQRSLDDEARTSAQQHEESRLRWEQEKQQNEQFQQHLQTTQSLLNETRARVMELEHVLELKDLEHKEALQQMQQTQEKQMIAKLESQRVEQERVHQQELQDLRASLQNTYKDQVDGWSETLEIASASVQAAERREKVLQEQVEALKTDRQRQEADNRQLEARIQELLLSLEASEVNSMNTSASIVETPPAQNLLDEIVELEEQIRNLKVTHAAQLRSERKRAREEMEEMEEQYGMKLEALRAMAANTARQQTIPASTAKSATVPHSPSFVRRVWQRMKRPFRR